MKSHSLIRQTVAFVMFAQLLCAALLCGAALLHERQTRLRALDVQLQGRSDSLLGAIQDAEDPDDNVLIDPAERRLPEDDVYAVYTRDGRLLGSSPGAPPELIARHAEGCRAARIGRTRYRLLQREGMRVIDRAENAGVGLQRPVTIVYASAENHLWHEIFEAVRFYLLVIAFATGLTMITVAVLLRRALSPLSELALAAGQLTLPALAFRAPSSVLRVRELRPLAEVLTDTVSMLREAFAREARFVGDAAHELKTAIAVVRSSVQLLMLRPRTVEEYAAGLGRVLEDNSRVETLVAQMLQLASTEQDAAANALLVDLGEVIATTLERLRPFAEERGVPLHCHPSPVPSVRLLPERGLALITNLVLNAVQHSAAGSPVTVTLTNARDREVVLQVSDAGAGIAADALPHIFERFFREDRSRSRDTGGAGLGLAICKSIVEAAGGSIAAESSPGHGTRITVIFITA